MVFVADVIGADLKRIVEFLNEQMRPAQVLAIELSQYVTSAGMRTLVPTLLGQTERARSAKSVAPSQSVMNEPDWLVHLKDKKGPDIARGAERALLWFREVGLDVQISSPDALRAIVYPPQGGSFNLFFVRHSTRNLEIPLGNLAKAPAFNSEESRLDLLAELKGSLPSVSIRTVDANGWPGIPLSTLVDDKVWNGLISVLRPVVDRVTQSDGRQ